MTRITLSSPLDMHLHLREGAMLKLVAPLSAKMFAGAVIMPNLVLPVDNREKLEKYILEIKNAVGNEIFMPYMTLFFRGYSEMELAKVKYDIIGVKLYPAGITTNSENGMQSLKKSEKTLSILQEMEIPLLVHGESGGFVLDREKDFLSTYNKLARKFPRLKIIMEHITTREAVKFLDKHENLYATITLHHLLITLDDVAGGLLAPHLFCKPIAKRPEDRDALLEAALNAHPKVMFGSDSAPHPIHKKESSGCAAGIFSAPVSLPMLAELFAKHGALDNLQTFISDNARKIYKITPPAKTITLEKRTWRIPENYGYVVPFMAETSVSWGIVK
ncbi:dihydroorotase [candidate division KSB1 bacterium]|nr:dihydroorotase [candidate division KSB1 bacterium]